MQKDNKNKFSFKKCTLTCCVLLLALFVGFFIYVNENFGNAFTADKPLSDQNCKEIYGVKGPEDIVQFENFLIISQLNMFDLFMLNNIKPNDVEGGLFSLNLQNNLLSKVEIKNYPAARNMHAHGLYVKAKNLYVINHSHNKGVGEAIELFELATVENTLLIQYVKTLFQSEEHMGIFNNLVAYGDNENEIIFVTSWKIWPDNVENQHDQMDKKNLLGLLYNSLSLEYTYLYSLKNGILHKYNNITGIQLNGITLNQNKLYVMDLLKRQINVYEIQKDHQLNYVKAILLPYFADNLNFYEPENKIYAAGNTKIYQTIK